MYNGQFIEGFTNVMALWPDLDGGSALASPKS